MDFNNVMNAVKRSNNGSFRSMEWESEVPVKSALKGQHTVTKRTKAQVRFGVSYDHMASVQNKRISGELPGMNQGLRWGQWKDGYENLVIEHKGNHYLRCSLFPGARSNTQYLLDGQPVSKDELKDICNPSALKSSDTKDCFNVNMSNILSI